MGTNKEPGIAGKKIGGKESIIGSCLATVNSYLLIISI